MYKTGDLIVYRQSKHSTHPSRRAVDVRPTPNGEFYSYDVLKYWVVASQDAQGRVVVLTRRGKYRVLNAADPCLRKAAWWERLWNAERFPKHPEAFSRDASAPVDRSLSYQ